MPVLHTFANIITVSIICYYRISPYKLLLNMHTYIHTYIQVIGSYRKPRSPEPTGCASSTEPPVRCGGEVELSAPRWTPT